ncbi:HNH endonuclease [Treponema saccharophilum]|uniref:HNH endonuclease 5 domain-containing protein n=1 Tax=Treponema saccharophilum DSM 2985 TaxID=907348 RepID=H7EJK5_9SPIR|nr:HNH endonuclease [Treponema saccharophilum]EIC02243.1 hypothetical protein TresaDRAFT_1507 [Treponema saccharophilum DSM 2985]BDC97289.1 hypothetical protein TRSA_23880 [Treponema saccharophilum]
MELDKIQDLSTWWNDNYTLIADYDLTEKKYLGDSQNKICRFCGRKEPEVHFRKIAHAIPESLENINLFTNYECDECNHKFGNTIEDHLNKYLFPNRIASCILGKRGTITYKHPIFGDNRIDVTNGHWDVKTDGKVELVQQIDEHTLQINLTRQTYIPVNVYKALVKMAISIVPESEISNFDNTIKWLQSDERAIEDYFGKFVIMRFFPGLERFPYIKASLFKRKDDSLITPAYQFFICFSNYYFQIVVPCFKKDKQLDRKRFSFRAIPTPLDFSQSIKGSGLLDFSSHEPIKNEEAPIQMHFETSEMSIGEIE